MFHMRLPPRTRRQIADAQYVTNQCPSCECHHAEHLYNHVSNVSTQSFPPENRHTLRTPLPIGIWSHPNFLPWLQVSWLTVPRTAVSETRTDNNNSRDAKLLCQSSPGNADWQQQKQQHDKTTYVAICCCRCVLLFALFSVIFIAWCCCGCCCCC